MKAYTLSYFVHFLLLAGISLGQSAAEMKEGGDFERAAMKAYEGKTFDAYLANIERANLARPNHPRLIYNLARAYAVNGQPDKAIAALGRLAKMGLAFAVEKDNGFQTLFDNKAFVEMCGKFDANRAPVGASEKAFTLADKALITEGVAFDPKTGTYYVSSVHQRKIIAVGKDGSALDFSKEADGLWGVFGIRVDPKRRALWVTTMASPAMNGYTDAESGKSAVFRYDLATGRLAKKYLLPTGERHGLGDLTIDADGRVYATDSAAPVIYMIDPKADEIAEFVRSDNFTALQGLAVDSSGESLFVADFSKGIFRIEIASKQIRQLKPAEDMTLLGIDGLYFHRGDLIAVQNGVNPNRIVSFKLNGDRIERQRTLAAGHPEFLEPTLGVLSGDNFLFIANSQWPLVGEKGELDREKLKQPVILKIDLKKALAR